MADAHDPSGSELIYDWNVHEAAPLEGRKPAQIDDETLRDGLQSASVRHPKEDEMVEILRKLWTGELVEHHGRFFDFPPLAMSPAVRGEIPIVVGGISDAALRRVARLGDGWAPAYLDIDGVRDGLAKIRAHQREIHGEERPLSVYTNAADALGLDGFKRLADVGVTHAMAVPWLTGGGGTDIAGCLAKFNDGYGAQATRGRTAVTILSDGYCTAPPEALAAALARLRRRVRRVIWRMNSR